MLLRLARQLVEPRVHARALQAVLVPGAGAPARFLELLHELLVDVRLRILGQPFPLGSRDFDPIQRILAVDGFDELAQGRSRRAAGRDLRLARFLLGAFPGLAFEDRARGRDGGREAGAVGGGNLVVGDREQLAPRPLRLAELGPGSRHRRHRRRGRERFHPGDRGRDALLVLLDRGAARGFRIGHGLDHGAGALGNGLVLRAVGESVERVAIDGRSCGGALQRAYACVLVVGPGGDVEELRVVLDPLGGQGGRAGVGSVPRDRAQ